MDEQLRFYECMYISKQSVSDDEVATFVGVLDSTLKTHGGQIEKYKVLGVSQLAYPIKKKKRGLYVLMYFSAPGSALSQIRRKLSFRDDVLRHLILVVDSVPEEIEPLHGVEARSQ